MAKQNQNETDTNTNVTESVVVPEGSAAPVVVTEAASDQRFKMVKHDQTGEMVKRTDFIRECWSTRKMTRGDIARLLSKITGTQVPYQIVFASTKGITGGPEKAATETTSAPASDQQAAVTE